ncbi:MAG TPA: c-type cytochrome [Burkholderiales bacterium]|nr:c-type cytochrome [Burkholderiales bacterium]
MKSCVFVLGLIGALAVPAAHAQSGPEVLKAKGCLNCHEADKKKVGPAYKDVAAKYKDDKGAEAKLVAKIKEGKDHPKIAASDAELKAALDHVLSMK